MKKVLIIAFDNTGLEYLSLRQVLESFGFSVLIKYIGRPNHFTEVLEGKMEFDPDYIIISCHGEEGKIIMPVLAMSIYTGNEPRTDFSDKEISQYLKIKNKIIINTGCMTGTEDMLLSFSRNQNVYIAPNNYIEGSSALFFVINFFYILTQNNNVIQSFESAKNYDKETMVFVTSNNLYFPR
ncbi:MAG: hypothetical protein U1C51_09195 [Candidatus Izemoplasmatales bacterium]|nr:delta-aminolevulinic acid dehydratase [bacterium]MDZ4197402.1 hypothetical protein [Candidatus Izemoplasmatales bacterium]